MWVFLQGVASSFRGWFFLQGLGFPFVGAYLLTPCEPISMPRAARIQGVNLKRPAYRKRSIDISVGGRSPVQILNRVNGRPEPI